MGRGEVRRPTRSGPYDDGGGTTGGSRTWVSVTLCVTRVRDGEPLSLGSFSEVSFVTRQNRRLRGLLDPPITLPENWGNQ